MTQNKPKKNEPQKHGQQKEVAQKAAPPTTDPQQEKIKQLEQELEKVKLTADEHFKSLQRAVADFQNLKKQTVAEKTEFVKFANASLVLNLLEVFDDLERAINSTPEEITKSDWYKGILLVRQNFLNKFEKEGLKRMQVMGQKFDPNLHEALMYQQSSDIQPEHIISEVKGGFLLGDKVLRPAQVIVSKGK